MSDVKSVMIVGVGGQGSLLASRILGNVLLSQGFDVKMSEVHGMAQRGGSVVTYVKYGKKVYSPTVETGQADIIISFELLEGARYLSYLKKGGKVIINNQEIEPMPVITGAMEYPKEIPAKMKELGIDCSIVNALEVAKQVGSSKAVNVVLMGALSNTMEFDEQVWLDAVKQSVPEKFLEMNLKAFTMGRQLAL